MKSKDQLHRDIEAKHGFILPPEYIALNEQGCMEILEAGKFHADLVDANYLWIPVMEWVPPSEMIPNKRLPSYSKPGLISFAFTGGADNWCFYPSAAYQCKVPVIQCPRDDRTGTFFG